ncbi:hypothetical protein KIPB_011796, partial [Kipferlia bialata]
VYESYVLEPMPHCALQGFYLPACERERERELDGMSYGGHMGTHRRGGIAGHSSMGSYRGRRSGGGMNSHIPPCEVPVVSGPLSPFNLDDVVLAYPTPVCVIDLTRLVVHVPGYGSGTPDAGRYSMCMCQGMGRAPQTLDAFSSVSSDMST